MDGKIICAIFFVLSQILVAFVPYRTVPEELKPAYDFVLRYRNKVINRRTILRNS